MAHIFKCPTCDTYTMKEKCSKCKEKTKRPVPPRFSPQDQYGKYRRAMKKLNEDKINK
ncbi:MAG: RNA-protein complex protein Nop10 [DPANN group archaeon]|nr:RNA-protein complex protein Nop10 [DPANN group archaeon]